jgi:hypothetical protein
MRTLFRILVALSVLLCSLAAYANNVTISGTTTFAALDGGVDDEDHVANGIFTVSGNLTINGTINCNDTGSSSASACPMQFVVGGNVLLAPGSGVFAENRTSSGNGADITFTAGGNFLMQGPATTFAGALISSSKINAGNPAHAGNITINASGTVTQEAGAVISAAANDSSAGTIAITGGGQTTIAGMVLAGPSRTISTSTIYTGVIMSGGGGHVVGGAITIKSLGHTEPGLVIASTAIVAGQGGEAGPINAKTVALEGCNVQVSGLVASLARDGDAPRVVVRSGTTITIDGSSLGASGTHLGMLRADATHEDATNNRVDLYAAKDIVVTGPPSSSTLFAATSNPGTTDKHNAGTITVISTGGAVTASGNAFQVSSTHNGDRGGNVNVSAKNAVTLSGTVIDASGATSDANRAGGHIAVRSYSAALNWTAGVGDVRPVGSTAGVPVGQQGTISLTYCTTLSTAGTSFPTNGSPVGVFPTTAQTCSPAAPSLPAGETLPVCNTPPVANDTNATTLEDHSVTITMTASDADGDSLTFSILTNPAHGVLSAIFNATPTSAQVTYTPDGNYNGGDSFTFQADDGKGGTSTGTVSITVTPVNDPPTFTLGANPVSSLEDAGLQTLAGYASNISAGPTPDEASQTVTFTVTNDNNALFSVQPAISSSGTLTYTTAPNASGSANVTVVAHDNGGTANGGSDTSASQNFNIFVTAVNDAPSFTKGNDVTVLEDSGAYSQANWATAISAGPADESSQTVSFNVTNNNNALFSAQPAVDASGTLTFTPAPNANGTATVSVAAHDDGGTANGGVDTSAAQTFTITVTAVNDAPSFTSGGNVTVLEDSGAYSAAWATAISAGPADESSQTVSFTTSNDNNALFSAQPSIAADGTLTFTPAPDANGTAIVTVTAHDDGGTANGGVDTSAAQTFTITVTAVNDAPSFDIGGDQHVLEDAGAQTVAGFATNISAGPANESGQTLTFQLTNTHSGLFSVQPAIDPATGNLTYTLSSDNNGYATVYVTLKDNGGTANGGVDTSVTKSFTIFVTAVNDPPQFTKGADQSVLEDSGAHTVAGWATDIIAGPGDEQASQTVTFTTSNNNTSLFTVQPSVDPSGNLTYTLAADAFGVATVSVVAHDDGGTANGGSDTSAAQTFTITVVGVNDAPSFTKGPDVAVVSDAGPQTYVSWATNISAGPANESSQTVSFLVSNDNNGAFTAQPAVDSAGTLTFTTAVSAPTTTVHVSVAAHDNGGTANGGVDTSAAQTFNINITHANQPPVAGADSFDAVGNTELAVSTASTQASSLVATGSVLANDSDPDGDPIVAAFSSASAGASVTVNPDGTFTYLPPAGFTGDDTFTYTVSDDHGHTVPGTVTIHVTKRVLYVKNDGGGSTGRVDSPYATLAAAQAAAADNDTIYVFTGDGTTSGQSSGYVISHNGERLIGEGVALKAVGVYNGATNPQLRAAGSRPKVANAGGDAVKVLGTGTLSNNEVSGIEISSALLNGVNVSNAANFVMDSDHIVAATRSGVNGTTVNGFSFTNGDVVASGSLTGDGNVTFSNLTGSATVANSTFAGAFGDNIRVANTTGTLNRLTFNNVTLNGNSTTTGNNAVQLSAGNGTTMNVTVTGSHFTSTRGQHFQLSLSGSAVSDLVFTGNTVSNTQGALSGGGGIVVGTGGGGNPVLTYNIANNSIRDAVGTAINVAKGAGTGTATGTIDGNTVGVTGIANSGSTQGSGISVFHVGGGTSTAAVTNNVVAQYNSSGILVQVGDNTSGGNGTMNAHVTGNTISNPGAFAFNGFLLNAGTVSGDAHFVCLTLGGAGANANSVTGSGANGATDIRLRQRMATTVRLSGYVGANNDNAAVQAYVQSTNGGTPTVSAANTVPTGGGFIGGTCP